jgi:hypothetical protein
VTSETGRDSDVLLNTIEGQLGAEELEKGLGGVGWYEGLKVKKVEVQLIIDCSAWYSGPR